MNLHQIQALCTELWHLDKEFHIVRYANSFQVGLTLVIETYKDYVDIHGPKRYIQAMNSKQAQHWFHCINGVLSKYMKNVIVTEAKVDDNTDDLELEEEELE